jgi:hypothetical protein
MYLDRKRTETRVDVGWGSGLRVLEHGLPEQRLYLDPRFRKGGFIA